MLGLPRHLGIDGIESNYQELLPESGSYKGAKDRGKETPGPIRGRFIRSRITLGAARWEQAFSLDVGNSWETKCYLDFTRA